jgi:hypothetical protein
LSGADEGFRAWGEQIVQEFTALREDRNFLIHGIGIEVLKGRHSILKIRSEKARLGSEERVMSSDFMVQLGDRSWDLAKTALKYAIFLLRFVPPEQLRTLDAEFLKTFESL